MKLSSGQIKEFLRAQIANRDSDMSYFLKQAQDSNRCDPSIVLEAAQGAAMHKERKASLQEVLCWIEEMESR